MNKSKYLATTSLGFGVLRAFALGTALSISSVAIAQEKPIEPANIKVTINGATSTIDNEYSSINQDFGGDVGNVTIKNGDMTAAELVNSVTNADGNLNVNDFYAALSSNDGIDDDPSDSAEAVLLVQLLGDDLAPDGTVSKEDFLKALPAVYQASYLFNDEEGNSTDENAPVSSTELLRALPKSWSAQEVASFRAELRTKVDKDGNLERQDAIDFLVEEVTKNPGDSLHQGGGHYDLVGEYTTEPSGNQSPVITIVGTNDLTVDNEVGIFGSDRGILIASADMDSETLTADVTLINSGYIQAPGDAIAAIGINVDVTNSGNLKSEGWNGIKVNAEGDATVDNTGAISAADTAIETRAYGQVTVKNAGDLTVSSLDDGMGDYHNYNQFDGISAIGLEGATVENHGNISDAIWAIEVAGSFATVTNTGDLSAAIGIDAVSIAGSFDFTDQGNDEDDDFIEKGTLTGGSTTVNNTGDISLNGDSYGDAYKYGEHRLYIGHIGIIGLAVNGLEIEYTDGYGGGTDVFTPLATLADTTQLNVTITNSGNIIAHADSAGNLNSHSMGIAALAEDKITITNSGIIDVAEAGIKALGNGEISITNSGAINVSNSNGGTGGIAATSGHWISGELGEAVDITNTAKISVDGDHMRGIRAWSNG
ncbi:MAG: hypothetical protein COC00_010325, partial [Rhizobiales bacterium]|nr:hypothetical protein [Hyphomicrobiales bacterium]